MSSRLVRQPFTQDDKDHLVEWLAANHPEKKGLMGHTIWRALIEDKDARPWNANHTWQSWRDQYRHNESYYANKIEQEFKKRKNSSTTVKQSFPRSADGNERQTKSRPPAAKSKPVLIVLSDDSNEDEEESEEESAPSPRKPNLVSLNVNKASRIRLLAEYYARNDIPENIRSRADTLQDLAHNEDCQSWVKQLRPIEWRDFYTINKKAITEQILALEQLGDQNPIQERVLKRRAVPDESASDSAEKQATSQLQRSPKKRRLETLVEEAHDESDHEQAGYHAPDEAASAEVERGPPTSEAPSSTTATPPRKAARRLRAVYATPESVINDDDDESVVDDRPSEVKLHTAEFDHYGVPGSPSGTLPPGWQQQQTPVSRIITPMVSRVDGLPRFDGRVPTLSQLYPSLTLPPMGQDTTPRVLEMPDEVSQATATPIVPDPDVGVPETPMPPSQSGSFTSRMKGIVGKIFPTTLPSLAPIREKRAHLSGMDTVLQRDGMPQAIARSYTETPDHDYYDIQVGQPSPMPYVGSDGRSTRSYSFSQNADDSAQTIRDQGWDQEGANAVEEDEVDELIDDELEDELPPPQLRFVPSRNLQRHESESSLFASTASTTSDTPNRRNTAAASRHYPVREKITAAGLVRQRGQRPSQRGPNEDSDSVDDVGISQVQDMQNISSDEDEDKENRPREANLPLAAKPAALRRLNPSVRYEDLGTTFNQDTPEMHPPKESLTLVGVTPPGPHITATSFRSDMRAGSKATRAILKEFHTEKPASKSITMNDEEFSLKPLIPLTSPDLGSDFGVDLDANGDPSPLSRKTTEGDKAGAMAKVRFDTMTANRDRRKTTGGIGTRFGDASLPTAFASVPRMSFHPPPVPKPIEKLVSESDPIDLDSDEKEDAQDDDESPLARYSQASRMATSSPNKSVRRSVPHSTATRSSFGQRANPPPPIPVPIVTHSSSPDPSPQKPVMPLKFGNPTAVRRSGMQNIAEAAWSPIKFPQMRVNSMLPPAETLRSAREQNNGSTAGTSRAGSTLTGMTLDYRDQRETAKWLQSKRGRPVIISREMDDTRRRSAPLPTPGDVVYLSDSPRRVASRSRSRSTSHRLKTSKKSEIEVDDGNIGELSNADCKRIVTHMISHGLTEPDAPFGPSEMFDGLAAYLIHLARSFNFRPKIAQEVWKACWDLEETEGHLARMFGAAKTTGDRGLDVDLSRVGNEELLEMQERQERRRRIVRESLGAVRTRRVSDQLEKSGMLSEEDQGSEDDADSERSQPPSGIPFGVLQPLLS